MFLRICIALGAIQALGRQGRNGRALCEPKSFLFESGAASTLLIGTFQAAAICSTVSLVGFSRGFPTSLEPFELHGSQPALLTTEDLSRMAGRKETIALLPKTVTPRRKLLRYLRSGLEMIRIGNGQSGVLVPRVKSRCRRLKIYNEAFFEIGIECPTLVRGPASCGQEIATTPATLRKWLILSCD